MKTSNNLKDNLSFIAFAASIIEIVLLLIPSSFIKSFSVLVENINIFQLPSGATRIFAFIIVICIAVVAVLLFKSYKEKRFIKATLFFSIISIVLFIVLGLFLGKSIGNYFYNYGTLGLIALIINIPIIVIEIFILKGKSENQNTVKKDSIDIGKLEKYKELFDKGIITQEEFDEKKKQLFN